MDAPENIRDEAWLDCSDCPLPGHGEFLVASVSRNKRGGCLSLGMFETGFLSFPPERFLRLSFSTLPRW